MTELPRPNFFLVGSMRSGTTSLHRHLTRHPEIFMSTDPKEPSYFLEREQLLEVFPEVEKRGFWKAEANLSRAVRGGHQREDHRRGERELRPPGPRNRGRRAHRALCARRTDRIDNERPH